MSEYVKLAVGAGDQYLTALAEIQETFLKSVSAFAASIATAPAVAAAPLAVDLPTPREVAETNFTFTEKLLKQQKAFTEKFFAASTPAAVSAPSASGKR